MSCMKRYQFLGSSSAKLAFRTVTQNKPAELLDDDEKRALMRLCDFLHGTGGEVRVEDLFHTAKHRSYLAAFRETRGSPGPVGPAQSGAPSQTTLASSQASHQTQAGLSSRHVAVTGPEREELGACGPASAPRTLAPLQLGARAPSPAHDPESSPLGSASGPPSDAFSGDSALGLAPHPAAAVPASDSIGHRGSSARAAPAGRRRAPPGRDDARGSTEGAAEDAAEPRIRSARARAIRRRGSAEDAASDESGPESVRGAAAALEHAEDWELFDVRRLAEATGGRPLAPLVLHLLRLHGVPQALGLDEPALGRYLRDVEDAYLPNPYHCALHAADVVQAIASIMATDGIYTRISPVEALALIVGAAVHDLAHPGLRNEFLVRSSDARAVRYNDISVNENVHASTAFEILRRPGNDFFPSDPSSPADLARWLETGGSAPISWPAEGVPEDYMTTLCRVAACARATAAGREASPAAASPAAASLTASGSSHGSSGDDDPMAPEADGAGAQAVEPGDHSATASGSSRTSSQAPQGPSCPMPPTLDSSCPPAARAAVLACCGRVDGPATYREFRRLVIAEVLATDCDLHDALCRRVEAAADRGPARRGGLPARAPGERADLLGLLLHVADISNPARPLDLCVGWAQALREELKVQGLREAQMGFVHACPATDPDRCVLAEGQVGFICRLLRPTLELVGRCACPKWCAAIERYVDQARAYWLGRVGTDADVDPELGPVTAAARALAAARAAGCDAAPVAPLPALAGEPADAPADDNVRAAKRSLSCVSGGL